MICPVVDSVAVNARCPVLVRDPVNDRDALKARRMTELEISAPLNESPAIKARAVRRVSEALKLSAAPRVRDVLLFIVAVGPMLAASDREVRLAMLPLNASAAVKA